jgi:DNA-binding GntR family transcriptional regulator
MVLGVERDSGLMRVMAVSEIKTRAERLAAEIADAVLNGEFAPGARLDEQKLADRFGVSRTPVREALRQLGTSGLIELKPHRGATVTKVTSAKLEEMFGAMAEIEATCARLAAISMTPIERRRLETLHDRMGAMAAAGDDAAYIEANLVFHAAIYAGSHNGIIGEIATGLRHRLLPFRRAQFRMPGRLLRSHGEHDAVVRAVLCGDAAAAHAAMLRHVCLVEDAFEALSAMAQLSERSAAPSGESGS